MSKWLTTCMVAMLLVPVVLVAQPSVEKAFPFELKDTLGYVHRLDDFRGKTLVMDFWFTGCKGCVQVARMLREQVKPAFRGDTSVVFIAVSLDINFLQWKRSIQGGVYTSEGQLNLFTNGMGGSHPIYKHYGFSGAPQLLVIDPEGDVVSRSVTLDGAELVGLINRAKARAAEHVQGSTVAGDSLELAQWLKPLQDRFDALTVRLGQFRDNPDTSARLLAGLKEIYSLMRKAKLNFVVETPGSPIALATLVECARGTIDPDEIGPAFDALPIGVKNSDAGREFGARVEAARKTRPGEVAMDFVLNDPNGVSVSLSSFRGKYVLLDFWSSRCGPCRAKHPQLVRLYGKHKSKDFDILGVSLDRPEDKSGWLKAIDKDGLPWTQVSDLQGWDGAVAKMYDIRSLPQNLLIDPSGIILAKDLEVTELEAKLAEICGKAHPVASR